MAEKNENLFVADIADENVRSTIRGIDVGVNHVLDSEETLRRMMYSPPRSRTRWERFCHRVRVNWRDWLFFALMFFLLFW